MYADTFHILYWWHLCLWIITDMFRQFRTWLGIERATTWPLSVPVVHIFLNASLTPKASNSAVLVHQLSKGQSQSPFSKSKGLIQRVLFHPSKPIFFVATQQSVRVYNLMKQEMIKKLQSGVKWISSMDIHPGGTFSLTKCNSAGDNVIIGSYDKRLCWFDMDLSTKPYKTLRYVVQSRVLLMV